MEIIEHNGDKFVWLDTAHINLSAMTKVQKISEVVAAPVAKGRVKVITRHKDIIETINYANSGDFVVYEIGTVETSKIAEALVYCDRKVISKVNFNYLYTATDNNPIHLEADEIIKITQDLILDNQNNKDFVDSNFLHNLKKYKYIGKAVYASSVPFNFVVKAPWGQNQFIKRGGMIIYDTNISNEPEIYGIEGAHDRVAGEFEKTFTIVTSSAGNQNKVIADTFKMALKADRSPISGIQFNNIDLAKAYDRAGKKLPHFLKKFLE
jgi:hypothetical protein